MKSATSDVASNSGLFHTKSPLITGMLTGAWSIVGWANVNNVSPLGAGVLSTSSRDAAQWPNTRFLNINSDIHISNLAKKGVPKGTISANFVGPTLKS